MDAEPYPSPCVSICQIDPATGNCLGCHRTRDEIAAWPAMTPDAQRHLVSVLHERRAAATGRPRRQRRHGRAIQAD